MPSIYKMFMVFAGCAAILAAAMALLSGYVVYYTDGVPTPELVELHKGFIAGFSLLVAAMAAATLVRNLLRGLWSLVRGASAS